MILPGLGLLGLYLERTESCQMFFVVTLIALVPLGLVLLARVAVTSKIHQDQDPEPTLTATPRTISASAMPRSNVEAHSQKYSEDTESVASDLRARRSPHTGQERLSRGVSDRWQPDVRSRPHRLSVSLPKSRQLIDRIRRWLLLSAPTAGGEE